MDYRAEIMSLEERNPSGCQGALVPGIIAKGKGPKFIVFGLNPAEAKDDKEEFYDSETEPSIIEDNNNLEENHKILTISFN